jgi:hypothetical protein
MIEKVIRFRTNDGKIHETEEHAEDHIVRSLEAILGPYLDKHIMGPRERLALMNALFPDVSSAQDLINKLSSITD